MTFEIEGPQAIILSSALLTYLKAFEAWAHVARPSEDVRRTFLARQLGIAYAFYAGVVGLERARAFGEIYDAVEDVLGEAGRTYFSRNLPHESAGNLETVQHSLTRQLIIDTWMNFEYSIRPLYDALILPSDRERALTYKARSTVRMLEAHGIVVPPDADAALAEELRLPTVPVSQLYQQLLPQLSAYSRDVNRDRSFLDAVREVRNDLHANFVNQTNQTKDFSLLGRRVKWPAGQTLDLEADWEEAAAWTLRVVTEVGEVFQAVSSSLPSNVLYRDPAVVPTPSCAPSAS